MELQDQEEQKGTKKQVCFVSEGAAVMEEDRTGAPRGVGGAEAAGMGPVNRSRPLSLTQALTLGEELCPP